MRLSVIRIRFVQPFVLFELELVSAGGLGRIDVSGKAHMVHIVYASMERFAESSDIALLSLIEELSGLCIAFVVRYSMRMIIYFEPFHSRWDILRQQSGPTPNWSAFEIADLLQGCMR